MDSDYDIYIAEVGVGNLQHKSFWLPSSELYPSTLSREPK